MTVAPWCWTGDYCAKQGLTCSDGSRIIIVVVAVTAWRVWGTVIDIGVSTRGGEGADIIIAGVAKCGGAGDGRTTSTRSDGKHVIFSFSVISTYTRSIGNVCIIFLKNTHIVVARRCWGWNCKRTIPCAYFRRRRTSHLFVRWEGAIIVPINPDGMAVIPFSWTWDDCTS